MRRLDLTNRLNIFLVAMVFVLELSIGAFIKIGDQVGVNFLSEEDGEKKER